MAIPNAIQRALRRPQSYVGNLREIVGTGVCMALYPLGVVDAGLQVAADLLPQRGPRPTPVTTPVLLVHGYGHNRSGWIFVQRHLRAAGFAHVYTMNYNPLARDIPALAQALAERVAAIKAATGAARVHVAGHSLGGIILRYYVQILGGDEHVGLAITVATPHEGSVAAHLGLGPTAVQLRPDSWVIRRLHQTARPSPVRWIAYYSNLDLLVVPGTSAMLREPALAATNVLVKDHGHLSILLSHRLGRSIAQQLAAAEGVAGYGAPVAVLDTAADGTAPAVPDSAAGAAAGLTAR